ncbi:hypothetical protein ACP70R_048791 [Stipagrostis hirtigluma subsp. patula]
MADWVSDSDDGFQWDSDGDGEAAGSHDGAGTSAAASRNVDAPGPSTLAGPSSHSVEQLENFVGMGFKKNTVLEAMKKNGDGDADSLLQLILTLQEIENDPLLDSGSASGCVPRPVDDSDDEGFLENWDDEAAGGNSYRGPNSDDSNDEDFLQEMSQKDEKVESLVNMGFPEDEAKMAITRCGPDASVDVLVDFIYASQTAVDGYTGNFSDLEDNSVGGRKKQRFMEGNKKKRKRFGDEAQGSRGTFDGSHEMPMPLPNPMVGFGLPNQRWRSFDRSLPVQAIGPPYFYYENVALAPKGVWTTISRFLYDIQPEFVDSKFFCAAARKRGYIHNLPIENRSPLLPLPPKKIKEALPRTKKWWPSWDPREQLNCLQTCVSSAKLLDRIRVALANSDNPPPPRVQKYVLEECRKWNLVWVGRNQVAPLEPHEMECLLGFPMDHTRGISRTERYRSLGNSFQVDTVAYHLSVLRDMFPQGMNVLSLFSGIGGAEVALHRLGIRMKTVVSVEKSKVNRTVLKNWWDETQTGTLIEIDDVQILTAEKIEWYVRRIGGFDLVIGGSPCNNLAGSNRHHRDGLEGEHSALFYHYFRILDSVKSAMERM